MIMPGINGDETCQRLPQTHGENCAPIIFLTEKNASNDIVKGLWTGSWTTCRNHSCPKEALARIRKHVENRFLQKQQMQLVTDRESTPEITRAARGSATGRSAMMACARCCWALPL